MRNRFSQLLCIAALAMCVVFSNSIASAQISSFERPPIDYLKAEVNDPVAQLAEKIKSGEIKLEYDEEHGYLASILTELDVPVSSQVLVFSKTSLQLHRISPRRPRAVYFNDNVYVGWCQRGDVLEFASTDPMQGAMFYTLKQQETEAPKFVRDQGQCLACHASSRTQGIPGYLVRSVYTDGAGHPVLGSGTYLTDHTSPFEERWGGWYVSGKHGSMRHMGNSIYKESEGELDRESGANLDSLDKVVSTAPYLSPHSDLVSLMVLEHQTQMHNAIAAANYETRLALHQSYQMNELLEREEGFISESAQRRIESSAENVVSYLLMHDEYQLEDEVSGSSDFASEFVQRGKRDSKGRSLRDFDLKTRLFKYPCSFLIYSDAFDTLPDQVHQRVIEKLRAILEANDDDPEYPHLTPPVRKEILEILRETKPEIFDNVTDKVDAKNANVPESVDEARRRARLLHETIHGTLQVVHRDLFDEDESTSIPSQSLEDVFSELAKNHSVKLRWLVVETDVVNADHEPQNDFERQAVKELARGKSEFEKISDDQYQFAGPIQLASQCLKCHVKNRTSLEDRTAGLVISMPLRASD